MGLAFNPGSLLSRVAPKGAHARTNLFHGALLVLAAAAYSALAGGLLFGMTGVIAAVAALAIALLIALRSKPYRLMRLYGGRPPEPGSLAQAAGIAATLAERAELRTVPHLYVIPSFMLTAFSLGDARGSSIAITEGLLRRLSMREIAGVLAHEISHIRNGDPFLFGLADMLTRLAQLLYYAGLVLLAYNLLQLVTKGITVSWPGVVLLIIAPALWNMLLLSLPRAREFAADQAAAFLTADPMGLASAVSRLDSETGEIYDDLLPPVPARRVPQPSLLRCPPPAEKRIAKLRTLEPPPMPPLDISEEPRVSLVGVGPIEMRPRYRWPGVWF